MKVCLVSLGSLPALSEHHKHGHIGGAEVQLAQLAVALARHGHEVSMVVADLEQDDGARYRGVTTYKAFKPSAGLPVVRFVYPRGTSLWAAFNRADADVYLVTCATMLVGMLAMYCRFKRRRLVFRAASDSDCDPGKLLIASARDRWLYKFGLLRADAVLVQSEAQKLAMRQHFGPLGSIVRGLIERPDDDLPAGLKDIDVLWVANLRQLKRPDRFLDLAEAMPGLRFHMAGGEAPGEPALYQQIKARARGIANLTFHGQVPYLEVGRLFDRARTFANTSEIEGFPNTFLQAWIRGIPVVTMFDPDGLVARGGLGSAHASVAGMRTGVEQLLVSQETYDAAAARARAHMSGAFEEDEVLLPYLRALTGTPDQEESIAFQG